MSLLVYSTLLRCCCCCHLKTSVILVDFLVKFSMVMILVTTYVILTFLSIGHLSLSLSTHTCSRECVCESMICAMRMFVERVNILSLSHKTNNWIVMIFKTSKIMSCTGPLTSDLLSELCWNFLFPYFWSWGFPALWSESPHWVKDRVYLPLSCLL